MVEANKSKLFDIRVNGEKLNIFELREIAEYWLACCHAEVFVEDCNMGAKTAIQKGYRVHEMLDTDDDVYQFIQETIHKVGR